MPPRSFAKLCWFVAAYNVAVIAWGGFVRASGSGAGCGRHWPMCNGEVVPHAPRVATMIEFAHRLSSGLAVALIVLLAVLAFRVFPRGHTVRTAAVWSCVFVFGEALIGAGLVLFALVEHDASMKRALSMALHLTNTFFLLGALTLTALGASGSPPVRLRKQGPLLWFLLPAFAGMMLLGISGAVAALGDTLFPARSWSEGVAQDMSIGAHAFIRLRLLHPFLAVATGACVIAAAGATRHLRPTPRVVRASRVLTVAFFAQIGAGLLNLALLAPVAMQLAHLVLADIVWIALVVLASTALGDRRQMPVVAPGTTQPPAPFLHAGKGSPTRAETGGALGES